MRSDMSTDSVVCSYDVDDRHLYSHFPLFHSCRAASVVFANFLFHCHRCQHGLQFHCAVSPNNCQTDSSHQLLRATYFAKTEEITLTCFWNGDAQHLDWIWYIPMILHVHWTLAAQSIRQQFPPSPHCNEKRVKLYFDHYDMEIFFISLTQNQRQLIWKNIYSYSSVYLESIWNLLMWLERMAMVFWLNMVSVHHQCSK